MWIACVDGLPDSDTTVLIYSPTAKSEPVWLGYHDGEDWYTIDHQPTSVTHWQDMPEPPQG